MFSDALLLSTRRCGDASLWMLLDDWGHRGRGDRQRHSHVDVADGVPHTSADALKLSASIQNLISGNADFVSRYCTK